MSRICLITALAAETRPLLNALSCRQRSARHLRLYTSEHYLILETGPGKLNAAAATGALLQLYPDITAVVNIGIAGGLFNIGKTLVANRVQDDASGAQWFSHLPDAKAFRDTHSAALCTVDIPCTNYREGVLFDMEAAGIFTAATRYLSTSQVLSIKVISDNPDNPLQAINKHSVNQLISDALPVITPLLEALNKQHITISEIASNSASRQDLEMTINNMKEKLHHSVNDEQQLRRLLQQHLALVGKLPELLTDTALIPVSASALRHQLRTAIAATPLLYGDA